MDFKKIIANSINYQGLDQENIINSIILTPDANFGDYSLPCFPFAKVLRKSPVVIAQEIAQSLNECDLIEKVDVVNGYLNFYLNKAKISENLIENCQNLFKNKEKNNKVVCLDYSSVNLAKYMHIGHWNTTILGEALARLYENQGYKAVRMNYIGDYGLPFGKMVYAFKTWGNKQEVEKRGIDALQELYVKFCANESEELLTLAREISKKIEEKDAEVYPIYEWFIDISKKEAKRLLDKVGITFDTWRGESYYNDKMEPIIEEIKNSGFGKVSEGAFIVDLNEYNMGVSVIQRADGASLYVTRDLAALDDRYKTYNFDEMIYVTAVQQCNHFEKLFKICELLNKPYANKLYHASYGMFSMPEGKIASRKGKQALFEDMLTQAEQKIFDAFTNKSFTEEQKRVLAKKIGKSAVAFSILKVDRIKDKVYDADLATNFNGETAPYIEYTYARCNSIVKKASKEILNANADYSCLPYADMFDIIKSINNIDKTIESAFENKEPSILAREVISICKNFNKFYGAHKVVDTENVEKSKALINFVNLIKSCLAYTMPLLCIEIVEEM
ncbi:MAG: arginine--tRNA ligase [Clostridiales bacterium]|nr:arginine--tRNA ligase [Clostridiales bacterium]